MSIDRSSLPAASVLFAVISGLIVLVPESHAADSAKAKPPAAVRKTMKVEAGNGEIEDVQQLKTGKKAVWEVDVVLSGKSYELHIAADGTLIHKQLEGDDEEGSDDDEDEVDEKKATGQKKSRSAAKAAGKKSSAADTDDEEDDEEEDEDEELSLDDLPKAVRKALKREAAGGEIEEIERETEDGVTVYEATVEFETDEDESDDDDDADDDDDEEEEEDEEDDDDLVYEIKISKAGVVLSKLLVGDEEEDEDE